MAEHGHTAEFMQHLRPTRFHARALARGQHDYGGIAQLGHPLDIVLVTAKAKRFPAEVLGE